MPTYTIKSLTHVKDKPVENDETLALYDASLADETGFVTTGVALWNNTKFDTPKIGDELNGSIADDKYGKPKFSRAKRSGSSGGGGYKKSPEDEARISKLAAYKAVAPAFTIAASTDLDAAFGAMKHLAELIVLDVNSPNVPERQLAAAAAAVGTDDDIAF